MNIFRTTDYCDDYEKLSENKNEYTNMVLYMNKSSNKKVHVNINKTALYANRLYPKNAIDMSTFNFNNITLSSYDIDIVRTTPEYAFYFNDMINNSNSIQYTITGEKPYMKSYTDGYSFLGEAFINFVTALAVHEMFPNETSSALTNFANIFRNNVYISDVCDTFELSDLITKVRKDQQTKKKVSKQRAASFKGLIGMMLVKNGNDKILDIMKFVNKTVIPTNPIDFTGKEANDSINKIILCFICTLFGWISGYITFTLCQITICKFNTV